MPDDPFRQAAGQSPLGFGRGARPADRLSFGNLGHDLPHPIGSPEEASRQRYGGE